MDQAGGVIGGWIWIVDEHSNLSSPQSGSGRYARDGRPRNGSVSSKSVRSRGNADRSRAGEWIEVDIKVETSVVNLGLKKLCCHVLNRIRICLRGCPT